MIIDKTNKKLGNWCVGHHFDFLNFYFFDIFFIYYVGFSTFEYSTLQLKTYMYNGRKLAFGAFFHFDLCSLGVYSI